MQGIILTSIQLNNADKELLQTTDIYKLALNQHAEDLKPDIRLITDYVLLNILNKFPEQVISVRSRLRNYSRRVIYPDIEFKGATIIAAVDYLTSKGYDSILIVGDNTVHSKEHREIIKQELSEKNYKNLYQFSNGNFDLPVMSIKEFTKVHEILGGKNE